MDGEFNLKLKQITIIILIMPVTYSVTIYKDIPRFTMK